MKKIVLMSLVASSVLMAGGYKIPEVSTNAVALGAANIAHNKSADAAYYNPANMVFMEESQQIEVDLMYIGLDAINYKGSYTNKITTATSTGHNIDSKSEAFVVPSIHYVSGKLGDNGARVGLSIVSPGGLSKRWNDQPAKSSAEEFTLKVVEINPTAAFKVNDKVAVAVGFRIVYSEGIVKSNTESEIPANTSRDMTGDSIDFGYNLALAYKPTSDLEIGLTYRSQVNLTEEGSAKLNTDGVGSYPAGTYNGDAYLTVPLPAAFNAAIAYTLPTKTTIEVVYEKTYWSAWKSINFDYDGTLASPLLVKVFDDSKPKNWKDTETYRIGLTQELDALTVMAGLVFDESPTPEATLGYELPDSDSIAVSLGGRYKLNDKMDIALAALYSMHEDRTVKNDSIDGEFTGGNVLMISAGLGYKF